MKHIVSEFLIVVAGILVALAVDEWRQDRQELRILNESLADVAQEVRGNLDTIHRVQDRALARKMQGLETVIRFLNDPQAPDKDPAALLLAFGYSTIGATPWLVNDRFEALRNSGNLRLLRDPKLVTDLTGAYEGPQVLLSQVERLQGSYPTVVNEFIPASLQGDLSVTRWYVDMSTSPPKIGDEANAASAVEEMRAHREELLRLARAEAAIATAKWYALQRAKKDYEELLSTLAPWDTGARKKAAASAAPP